MRAVEINEVAFAGRARRLLAQLTLRTPTRSVRWLSGINAMRPTARVATASDAQRNTRAQRTLMLCTTARRGLKRGAFGTNAGFFEFFCRGLLLLAVVLAGVAAGEAVLSIL